MIAIVVWALGSSSAYAQERDDGVSDDASEQGNSEAAQELHGPPDDLPDPAVGAEGDLAGPIGLDTYQLDQGTVQLRDTDGAALGFVFTEVYENTAHPLFSHGTRGVEMWVFNGFDPRDTPMSLSGEFLSSNVMLDLLTSDPTVLNSGNYSYVCMDISYGPISFGELKKRAKSVVGNHSSFTATHYAFEVDGDGLVGYQLRLHVDSDDTVEFFAIPPDYTPPNVFGETLDFELLDVSVLPSAELSTVMSDWHASSSDFSHGHATYGTEQLLVASSSCP